MLFPSFCGVLGRLPAFFATGEAAADRPRCTGGMPHGSRVGTLRDAKIVDITVPKPADELLANFPTPSPWLCHGVSWANLSAA